VKTTGIYWQCEEFQRKRYTGRAVTTMVGNRYKIESSSEHNHSGNPCRIMDCDISNDVRVRAQITREKPSQIVQSVLRNVDIDVIPEVSSQKNLIQKLKRARRKVLPVEPQTLMDFNLGDEYKTTLSGADFYREIQTGDDLICLFANREHLRFLFRSNYWIMDGTFKTVPLLFRQLYTIHCEVGGINSRILPIVWVLMTSKSQACYVSLFQALRDLAVADNFVLRPDFVLTDFERAAMNAVTDVFPGAQSKGCHFHLAQIIFRKIQSLGMATRYNTDPAFRHRLRQLAALAFLPSAEIPNAFRNIIVPLLRNDCRELLKWFAINYVTGDGRVGSEPKFAPIIWSVNDNNELGFPRTSNHCEAWHNRWDNLLNGAHVGIYNIIENIREEEHRISGLIQLINAGEGRPLLPPAVRTKQQRMQTVIENYRNGFSNTNEFLSGIAHNLIM